MIAAIIICGAVVLYALFRSGDDISYAIGPYEYLEQADTSDGHYLTTLIWLVLGFLIVFILL